MGNIHAIQLAYSHFLRWGNVQEEYWLISISETDITKIFTFNSSWDCMKIIVTRRKGLNAKHQTEQKKCGEKMWRNKLMEDVKWTEGWSVKAQDKRSCSLLMHKADSSAERDISRTWRGSGLWGQQRGEWAVHLQFELKAPISNIPKYNLDSHMLIP